MLTITHCENLDSPLSSAGLGFLACTRKGTIWTHGKLQELNNGSCRPQILKWQLLWLPFASLLARFLACFPPWPALFCHLLSTHFFFI